ncbi:uncharacterized protein [Phaseolus vulgaris]|uniref:uncharacterized protein n=1 Tax=Phaseolus vulgaris TaxID=3885 RepID=UPI0035CB6A27
MTQVMDIMRTLQENVAASRSEQERMHEALVASQARNEELNRINEELCKALQEREERVTGDRSAPPSPPRSFPMPFSQEIMDSVVPASTVAVKASFTGVDYLAMARLKQTARIIASSSGAQPSANTMSGKDRRKALLELAKLRGAKGTGSSSSTTEPIAAPPLSVAPAEGPEQGKKRRKLVKAFPSSAAAAAAPSTEEESSGSPLVHRKRKLLAVEGASSLQPGEIEVVEVEEGQSLGQSAPPAGGASAHSGGLPPPLPTSAATAECGGSSSRPSVSGASHENFSRVITLVRQLICNRELVEWSGDQVDMHLARQMVLSLEFSTQHRKQIALEKRLRAETSSLRQLNSQLVGKLKSTKEAAATGEKKLEEVAGKLYEAKGQLEEAASSLAALTTEKNAVEASKQKLEAEKADLMNL